MQGLSEGVPRRALIIAIERYPAMQQASVLRGTTKSARDFATWLVKDKGLDPKSLYICARRGKFPAGANLFETTRKGIKDAICSLVADGRDQTEELYVFYSGHGFLAYLNSQDPGLNVLVPADFENETKSMDLPIRLDELQKKLKLWLGGECHFYFIDACRTKVEGEVSILGLQLELATKGKGERYALYSAVNGGPAMVDSGFAAALLEGLRGSLEAAEFIDEKWYVTLHSLRRYLESKLGRSLEEDGQGAIVLAEAVAKKRGKPVCEIVAHEGKKRGKYRVVLHSAQRKEKTRSFNFTGSKYLLSVPEGDWGIRLFDGAKEWPRLIPTGKIDLSSAGRVVFTKRAQDALAGRGPVPIASSIEDVETETRTTWKRLVDTAIASDVKVSRGEGPEIRVLLANEVDGGAVFACLNEGESPNWQESSRNADEFHRFRFNRASGSKIATFAFASGLTTSIATFAAEGWVTLMLVHRDRQQKLAIAQVLIPDASESPMLRMAFEIQENPSRIFERELYEGTGEPITRLFGYWKHGARTGIKTDVKFPDLIAIRHRPNEGTHYLKGVPLLLDNLLSVPGWEERIPFPATRLDYSSVWTCWRGAMNGPELDRRMHYQSKGTLL